MSTVKKATVKIVYNATQAKLITKDKEIRQLASEVLSYKVNGSEHMNLSSWDGVTSLYQMKNDQFPAGFVRYLKKKLERAGVTVFTKSAPIPAPQGDENPKVDNFPEDPRYDYQVELMNRFVEMRGMIAQVATGGGKSRCFKLCERRLNLPTLFITTRKSLMYQMSDTYQKDLKRPVGLIGDGHWSPIADGANFAIVDTLVSRIEKFDFEQELEKRIQAHVDVIEAKTVEAYKKLGLPTNIGITKRSKLPKNLVDRLDAIRAKIEKQNPLNDLKLQDELSQKKKFHDERRAETLEFLKNIGFLCLEEAHEVSGSGFYDVCRHCTNANYRLALTATPFMKDDEEANMKLMAVTGPVGIKVSEKLLIDRGILSTPYFKIITTPKTRRLYRSTKWQLAYTVGVVENEGRNQRIVEEVLRAKQFGLTSMILIGRQNHGKLLEELMTAKGIKCRFIYGAHEQKERKAALDALGNREIDCLIGSTILDVGVDVPSVGMVGLAGGGKAEVAQRQRIGRGLRAKKSGPNVCFIFDFTDGDNTYLARHARERIRIIEDTPGFAENIVNDFDYEGVGFERNSL